MTNKRHESDRIVFDLFCGCGGMSWGLEKNGFTTIGGVDILPYALETFTLNHKNAVAVNADITKLNKQDIINLIPVLGKKDLDCLIGGPPCQGFSKNVPSSYRFLEDPRNQLFKDYLRIVEYFHPKVIVMENVAEIFNAYNGDVREEVCEILERLGYVVKVKVLNAYDYGVPQKRRRCLFFASSTGKKPHFPAASHSPSLSDGLALFDIPSQISAWDAISDLPVLHNGEGSQPVPYDKDPLNWYHKIMRKDSSQIWDHITRELKETQFARINCLGAGQGIKDLPAHLRPKGGYSGAYGRLDFTGPSPTITRWAFHPGSGRFCHPKEIRLLTIRELARIQSFSDDFRFTGTYIQKSAQLGNAVPPFLMEALVSNIISCL